MVRVSVVIPTYNRAGYLREAMTSVLTQTFDDLDLIVCDNASDDDTAAVIGSFGDPRVRHVRRPENVGMIENHRRGLAEEVTGEMALMISDDDVLHPTMLEETVAVLDANPSVGMVHSAFRLIDGNGAVLEELASWTEGPEADAIERSREFIERSMATPSRVCATTALMRSEARPAVDPEDFPPIDQGMWLRLAVSWDVAYLHRPLADYRIHGASHSASFGVVSGAGYTFDHTLIDDVHRVKVRFLDAYGSQLPDARRLRRIADRARRTARVVRARQVTLPERRRGATARALADAVKHDPSVALSLDAWWLLGGSLLGRRVVDWLKRRA